MNPPHTHLLLSANNLKCLLAYAMTKYIHVKHEESKKMDCVHYKVQQLRL